LHAKKFMAVVGILLAGGDGRRFGGNKLLQPLPAAATDVALPLALASARNLLAALPQVIAVVRPGATTLGSLLREAGCRVVVCRHASEGMGTTLASAVRASLRGHTHGHSNTGAPEGWHTGAPEGWLMALADMPWIEPATLRQLAQALQQGAAIVAPSYHGERGHPVGFAVRFRRELSRLRGDEGARPVLRQHAGLLQLLPVTDSGVLRDVDTPADLASGGRHTRLV
jgi:molybdenum cofactor cytidylyltransferase